MTDNTTSIKALQNCFDIKTDGYKRVMVIVENTEGKVKDKKMWLSVAMAKAAFSQVLGNLTMKDMFILVTMADFVRPNTDIVYISHNRLLKELGDLPRSNFNRSVKRLIKLGLVYKDAVGDFHVNANFLANGTLSVLKKQGLLD